MKLITIRDAIRTIPDAWKKWSSGKKNDCYEIALKKLQKYDIETITAKEIEKIIGNSTWAELECNECKKTVVAVIQLGQEPDYDSATVYVCFRCLKKAIQLFEEE